MAADDQSAALVPEVPEPTPTEYQVGPSEVFGHAPGKRFKAILDPVQEARLIAGGAIKKVGSTPAEPTPDPKPEAKAPAPKSATPPPTNPPASPSGQDKTKE